MKDKQKAEEIAAQRMQLISPLLLDGLDAAKITGPNGCIVPAANWVSD